MFEYQQHSHIFAKCPSGLERMLADELTECGAERVRAVRLGVHAVMGAEALYRAIYQVRTCSHLLAPLVTFDCHSDKYLYNTAKDKPWEDIMGLGTTFVVDAHVADSNISHSQYAAQKLKDAIVDRFREQTGERPSVDRKNPDIRINLVILSNRAVISIDASGGSLHRRGYRIESVMAPIQETLAAAIVKTSGWTGDVPLLDPMCGSGTLLAEALLTAGKVPSGWKRCRRLAPPSCLPDFNPDLWQKIKDEGDAQRVEVDSSLVRGADHESDSLRATRTNLRQVPGGSRIELSRSDVRKLPGIRDGIVIVNPPYGVRLSERESVIKLYQDFGEWLKSECPGSTAYILCGNDELIGELHLKCRTRLRLRNGGIDTPLVEAEIRS